MMDSFPLKSGMFLLVALFFGLCAIICDGKQCNPAIEYSACDKKTGKVLACPKCRACKPGFEPIIPCGTVIDIGVTIGICRPCKDGHYSATKDVRSCQICQSSKCSVDEKVAGTCNKEWYDTSYCTGNCEDGYVMNNDKTRCEDISNLGSKTKKHPAAESSRPETNEEPPLEIIIPSVVGAFLLVTLLLTGLYKYLKNRRTENVDENSVNGGELPRIFGQEQNPQDGLPRNNRPHVPETSDGYVNSRQSDNDLSSDT